jgi:hypothetical protein
VTSLSPPLVSLIAQFEAATAEARSLAESTTEEIFTGRPDAKRWSAADCLDHLSTTNERYLRRLEQIVADAPVASSPRYRPTLVGRLFKRNMEPPVRFRLSAPKIFVPPAGARSREDVLGEFEAIQSRIASAIQAAASVDFSAVTMRSPVTPLLKLNLWDAFQVMAAHERRHLWQARKTVDALTDRA